MKNILKKIFALFLCIAFIVNTCIATVYASELPDDEREGLLDNVDKDTILSSLNNDSKKYLIARYLLSKVGVIASDGIDLANFLLTSDDVEIKYSSGGSSSGGSSSGGSSSGGSSSGGSSSGGGHDSSERPSGGYSITFKRPVVNRLLENIKSETKDTDNGGYELVKTVPVNKVSSLYFATLAEYRTMYELLKDNNGMLGVYIYKIGSAEGRAEFAKVVNDGVWIKGSTRVYSDADGKRHEVSTVYSRKNLNVNMNTYYSFYLSDKNTTVSKWEETGLGGYQAYKGLTASSTSRTAGSFLMNDYFTFLVNKGSGTNPLQGNYFLVTTTGSTIPVFNSIDDAIAYSVANNLYYTTSDFTGEGQEVTIDYDELDKILSGYYSGMYDMLQRLIEQNGGNALTPEQVQALADQVAESFDMLKTEINKGFEEQDKLIEKNSNILKGIKNTLDEILKYVKKIRFWAAADTVIDGIDLIADLIRFVKDFLSDVTGGVALLATGFSDIVNLVSKKFPFSIPWDIAFFVSSFADTPEAPVFELPLELPRYGIDEKLVIDFSRFEVISKISRSMLTVIYAMGLLKFTDKIISNKKGGAV